MVETSRIDAAALEGIAATIAIERLVRREWPAFGGCWANLMRRARLNPGVRRAYARRRSDNKVSCMRFSTFLGLVSAGLAAIAAAAQNTPPVTPPAESPKAEPGLSDLRGTVEGLQDQPPPQTGPQPAPAEPSTPPPATPSTPPAAPARPLIQRNASAFPLTPAEIAAVNRAAERGRLLIALSRAGIIATQDLLSRVSNPQGAGIDGWIAESEGQAVRVSFFDSTADGPTLVYRADVLGGRVTSRDTFLGSYHPAMSRAQARLVAARNAVEALNHTACSPQGFNILVIPPAASGAPIDVYETSAPSQRGRFPIGGHFRTEVTGNAQTGESHAFASACADIVVTEPPAGQQPPAVQIAAGSDPLPTEIHVLMSAMSGRALTFTAGGREWTGIVGDADIAGADGAWRAERAA